MPLPLSTTDMYMTLEKENAMIEFQINHNTETNPADGATKETGTIRLLFNGGYYIIDLSPLYMKGRDIEEYFTTEFTIQLALNYPHIPMDALSDFAADTYTALQHFDLPQIDAAFSNLLTEFPLE